MGMRFKGHSHRDFGPIRINYSMNGITSWSLRLGRRLSWNSRTRKWRFDTPGFGYVEMDGPAPPLAEQADRLAAKGRHPSTRRRSS